MSLLSVNNYPYVSWSEKFPDHCVSFKKLKLDKSWEKIIYGKKSNKVLLKEIEEELLSYALKKTNGKIQIFPYPDLIWHGFNATPFDKVKVVILGQDPYFNIRDNIPEAMGMSFSVPVGTPIPSSLRNIYANLINFGHLEDKPKHGNLSSWAEQGCLMLNTSLTVQKGHAGSHSEYWDELTDKIIKKISEKKDNVVFVLWGAHAYKKKKLIDDRHPTIISSHPSGLSCSRPFRSFPAFRDFDHFDEINKLLDEPIDWGKKL